MKSVSFSDLRNSSEMFNRSDVSNSADSNIKRSSSYKNLTHYSSSEDILKRFSSKTTELKNSKDDYKSDDNYCEQSLNPPEKVSNERPKAMTSDLKISMSDNTIQDLKTIIAEQENTISSLQNKNIILQNESHKHLEEIKFQENRIKYLEHMLAAFNTNPQENKGTFSQTNEDTSFAESATLPSSNYSCAPRNFNEASHDNVRSSNVIYGHSSSNNNEIRTDLKKRPNSADSMLHNGNKYFDNTNERDKYNPPDGRNDAYYMRDARQNQKMTSTDPHIAWQRQKLDKDRFENLSDFKNRLEEFSKYAKRSADQNSIKRPNVAAQSNDEMRTTKKYNSPSENYSDHQNRMKPKLSNPGVDSRPPIDPYCKQRRAVPTDVRISNDRTASLSSFKMQDLSLDEDANLKERVQKILEKHNQPVPAYRSDNSRQPTAYQYKSHSDYDTSGYTDMTHSRVPDRSVGDFRSSYQLRTLSDSNESNVPRLDLTLYNNASANDLIAKYLNYEGSTNVTY